ncbi:MAG TPA: thiamine pyrophosphate-dependent enzyme [Actinopolymorphaceae bacterium]
MREDPEVNDATRVELFRTMILLRSFHEAIRREMDAAAGSLGAAHGQGVGRPTSDTAPRTGMRRSLLGCEPMAAGFGVHLGPEDVVTAPRQPHYLAIARGVDLVSVVTEAIEAAHRHRAEPEVVQSGQDSTRDQRAELPPTIRIATPSSTGAAYLSAIGRAFASQQAESGRVAVSILDQSAAWEEGFRSAAEVASIWRLPLVFLICDDRWTRSESELDAADGKDDLPELPVTLPHLQVDSTDVEAACVAAGTAVHHVRSGEGPALFRVRLLWPNARDPNVLDPITAYESELRERGLVDDASVEEIRAEAAYRVRQAVSEAARGFVSGSGTCPLCEEKVAS